MKCVVYFHYLTVREKISIERKEPSTSEVALIGAELAIFKGSFVRGLKFWGPFWPLLILMWLHYFPNWLFTCPIWPLQWGQYFGPLFWAKSTFHLKV